VGSECPTAKGRFELERVMTLPDHIPLGKHACDLLCALATYEPLQLCIGKIVAELTLQNDRDDTEIMCGIMILDFRARL